MKALVAVAFDLCGISLAAPGGTGSLHKYAGPTPPGPFAPTLETAVTNFWPPGAAFQNKLTKTTLCAGQNIVQSGHDCGALIPHISMAPGNALVPVQWIMSSRKPVFDAEHVKQEGVPTAVISLLPLAMVCSEPTSFPALMLPTSCRGVLVEFTLMDLVNGLTRVLVAAAIDLLFFRLGGPPATTTLPGNLPLREALRVWGKELLDAGVGFDGTLKGTGRNLAKAALGSATDGLIVSQVREQGDNPTVKAEFGHPMLGFEISWNVSTGELGSGGRGLASSSARSEAVERITGPFENGVELL